jgi:hypothetical protein
MFAAIYRRAALAGDQALADRVAGAYVAHTLAMLDFYEPLTVETVGRPVPQILLIHVNDINAVALATLLGRLKSRGYGFVTLSEALRDPAYRLPDDYVGRVGPSWLHRWRVAKGMPSRLTDEPDPPKWVLDLNR